MASLLVVGLAHGQDRQQAETSTSVEGSLIHDGLERTFLLHAPPSRDSTSPAPLVIALHGGGGRGRGMEKLTGLSDVADREGFVVVFPDGVEKHWNDGRETVEYSAQRKDIDDVGFIAALVDHLADELTIDTGRVYVTGMSNGALIAHRIALEIPEKVAAIAPVEGTLLERLAATARPAQPVPVLIIKGLEAPLFERESRRMSAGESARYWAERNQCSPAPRATLLEDRDPDDGTRVRRVAYGSCREGAEVVLLEIEGGGHTWPGGHQYYPEDTIGRTSNDIDASELIWEFFERHCRSSAGGGG